MAGATWALLGLGALLSAAEPTALTTGSQQGTFEHGGRTRTYLLYVGRGAVPARPAPLMVVLHGGLETAEQMVSMTRGRFDELADRDSFLVLYPEGVSKNWNDGRGVVRYKAFRENVDDVGFLTALVEHFVGLGRVDPKRVYATGISNGAMMSLRLAMERPRLVRAVGAVAGGLPVLLGGLTPPDRPPSVFQVHGDDDPCVPFKGGTVKFAFGPKLGEVWSARRTVELFARAAGCPAEPAVEELPDVAPEDGTRVKRYRFGPGRDGFEADLLVVEGGGHTWPGGKQYQAVMIVGRTCRDVNAADAFWEFCTRASAREQGGRP